MSPRHAPHLDADAEREKREGNGMEAPNVEQDADGCDDGEHADDPRATSPGRPHDHEEGEKSFTVHANEALGGLDSCARQSFLATRSLVGIAVATKTEFTKTLSRPYRPVRRFQSHHHSRGTTCFNQPG